MDNKTYAHIDNNFNVINVIVSNDELVSTLDGTYIEYSASGEFRANPAGIGCIYDPNNDVFIPKQPYPSWNLNNETFKWEAPIKKPEGPAAWDEVNQVWNTPE